MLFLCCCLLTRDTTHAVVSAASGRVGVSYLSCGMSKKLNNLLARTLGPRSKTYALSNLDANLVIDCRESRQAGAGELQTNKLYAIKRNFFVQSTSVGDRARGSMARRLSTSLMDDVTVSLRQCRSERKQASCFFKC